MKVNVTAAIAMIAVLGAATASAKDCAGISFPDQIQLDGGKLALNGLGLRQATAFKVNVYVAALYVASPSGDAGAILGASTPKQLVLNFVRDVGAADLNKAWDEGFENNNAKEQLPALHDRIAKFKATMADMKKGQRLTFMHKPGAGIQVDVNGTVKATIEGDDFARALLSIWLGSKPPNPGLKTGLLGGACG